MSTSYLSSAGRERYARLQEAGKVDILVTDPGLLAGSGQVTHVVAGEGISDAQGNGRVMTTPELEEWLERLDT